MSTDDGATHVWSGLGRIWGQKVEAEEGRTFRWFEMKLPSPDADQVRTVEIGTVGAWVIHPGVPEDGSDGPSIV
jgi:hypothetical protein